MIVYDIEKSSPYGCGKVIEGSESFEFCKGWVAAMNSLIPIPQYRVILNCIDNLDEH